MAADHVVGEDLQFRLVVHAGAVRQQQRLRLHRAVGLLRERRHADLALKHAGRGVVDDVAENLAALAARALVPHEQRRVGVIAPAQQRRAAEPCLHVLSRERGEYLAAKQTAAFNQAEGVDRALSSKRRQEREHAHRAFALRRDGRDMIKLRAIAEDHDQRVILLRAGALQRREALQQRGAGAGAQNHQRARKDRPRGAARDEIREFQRPLQHAAGRNPQHRAVLHQGGVEGERRVLGVAGQSGENFRFAARQRLAQGKHANAIGQSRDVGEIGTKSAVEHDESAGLPLARQRRRRGASGAQRRDGAQRGAQIGVVPRLDAPVRQSFARKGVPGALAQRASARVLHRVERGF